MIKYGSRIIVISFYIFCASYINAQISSPQSYKEIITEDNIQLFLFNKINNISLLYNQDIDATFEWIKFNSSTASWDNIIQTQIGKSTTFVANESGGYALRITEDGTTKETYKCWILEPSITNLSIEVEYEDCFELILDTKYEKTPLTYFNSAGLEQEIDYSIKFEWKSEPTIEISSEASNITISAPVEDIEFNVSAIPFSNIESTAKSELKYYPLAVKAIYKAEELKADIPHELHTEMGDGRVIVEGSAPIEMRFTDESKGYVSSREWKFTGSKVTKGGTNPFHVFTAIGEKDSVLLTVRNDMSGCEDLVDDPIIVEAFESLVEAPNAFTPNGDGVYDEFRVVYRSIKKYKIVILNRWGRKVYESTNPAQGWDGKIGKSLAAPGVYFYVIEAEGFNKNEKHKLQGNIHLIRGR